VRAAAEKSCGRAQTIDSLIRELTGERPDIAVLAIGGYGRGRLSPRSDIDLLILTPPGAPEPRRALRELLYPLWDRGASVGHSVRTPSDTIEFAKRDLYLLTALTTTRCVGGAQVLYEDLIGRRDRWFSRDARTICRSILESAEHRRRTFPRAAWSLAPNIKDGAGGLRDVNTIQWLQMIGAEIQLSAEARDAVELLYAIREPLHDITGRRTDELHIEIQGTIAHRLGYKAEAVDQFMSTVHISARKIEHETTQGLDRAALGLLGGPRRSGATTHVAPGIAISDGALRLTRESDDIDLATAIRLLAIASHTGRRIALDQYGRLEESILLPTTWTRESRDEWIHLLAGKNAVAVLELLDNLGVLSTLLPEWNHVRGRALYDPYHQYTVDGHSFHAVAEISNVIGNDPIGRHAATEAGDLTSLYFAALLHDVGKGSGGDHALEGERLARSICKRMGYDHKTCEEVAYLVRHHLLLTDTATRRDLDDGAEIERVAKVASHARGLQLLYLLSVADARATGPRAWTDWKASLLAELYRKVMAVLETGDLPPRADIGGKAREVELLEPALIGQAEEILSTLPPSYLSSATPSEMAGELQLLSCPPAEGNIQSRVEQSAGGRALVTIVTADRPGMLARTAGVLSLNRISILKAQAYSTSSGLALQRFVVEAPSTESWNRFHADLTDAFAGRLALDARLRRKALDYRPRLPLNIDVRILDHASEHSTVIEVRARDALGLLYCTTAALADLDVDIHVAKIDTMGNRVIDVFYVRNSRKIKLDVEQASAVSRAITDRITNTIELTGSP
jgi:[protein-PII] uridylyltransferase